MTSAPSPSIHSKKPLVAAERMPLTLAVMIFMTRVQPLKRRECSKNRREVCGARSPAAAESLQWRHAFLSTRLHRLGRYYAETAVRAALPVVLVFGPAYKGVPLAVATVIALAEQHGRDLPYAFNRKEAKDHGEGGTTVGAPLRGKVLIVDDVISAGTSVAESIALI